MSKALSAPERSELRALLLSWQRGDMTFYEAVEEAEAIEDRTWNDVDVIEFPANDPRRIATEVVSALSMGFVAPLFVEDIPHLVACLAASPGDEEASIVRLWKHLESISADERLELAVQRYSPESGG